MFRFNVELLLRNKVLWAWPIIAVLLAAAIGFYGDIQSAGNSYSFLLAVGGNTLPSGFMINGLIDFFILIAVIGIPSHFSKNLDSERASLILSKPIDRTGFFLAEFGAVMTVSFFYTLITDIVLAVLLFVEAGIFPFQLYLAILFYIPLLIFTIYISIVLLLILTHSYLASVLIAYLLIVPLSSFFLNAETVLNMLGFNSDLLITLTDGFSYLVPSAAGAEQLMSGLKGSASAGPMDQMMAGVLHEGFAVFDWQLFGFVLISCLPFFLLSFYLMRKKEF